jgi:deoxyribose-phosphate aldolase
MKLSARDVARLIDISAVQAPHGSVEITDMARAAREYHFIAVHVQPCWVSFLRKELADTPDVLLGGPVGFPAGGSCTETKIFEAKQLVRDGVQELDMMLNVGKLRSGEIKYCEDEIRSIVNAVKPVPVKVIIEVHYLNQEQIRHACEVCIAGRAAFVKTGTGWTPTGATLEIIRYITSLVGDKIAVKASGGIRDLDTLQKMYAMGVQRFGINLKAAVEIVQAVQSLPGGCVDV